MLRLRPPSLGPIVGHTTDTSARVWVKATDPKDRGVNIAPNRRSIGVIAVTEENSRIPEIKKVHYFRLRREHDRTGIFTLGEDIGIDGNGPPMALSPNTCYAVRLGTLTISDPSPNEDCISNHELMNHLPRPEVWWKKLHKLPEDRSLATFTTFPSHIHDAAAPDPLAFLVGSCRYPGIAWQAKTSDEIFGPLLSEANGRDDRSAATFVMMVGDQIYADKFNRNIPIGLADTYQEYQERYLDAFGSRRMRNLLRSKPIYMILDDHEIEDNWKYDRISKAKKRKLFNVAIEAYRRYQWVHSPRNFGNRLFYDFSCGGYPFFVLDTRTQRRTDHVERSLHDNHLLGRPGIDSDQPSQIDELLHWLRTRQEQQGNTPKFVVSPSVFVPNPIKAREGRIGSNTDKVAWKEQSDSWPAFPNTRRAVLQTIIEYDIQNVVFICGDIHCSNVANIRFSGSTAAQNLKAVAITSSALYWPWCFADGEPSDFVHDSTAEDQHDTFDIDGKHRMDYIAANFTQEDNFCRVDLDPGIHQIVVRPFDRDGNLISAGGNDMVSIIDLEPW